MSAPRYSLEFKQEAIKQVTERGHSVAEVGARLCGGHASQCPYPYRARNAHIVPFDRHIV